MENKQARKMIESVSGGNFIFDVAPRGYSTTGAVLWVLDKVSIFDSLVPSIPKTERVNRKVSLTADQLKEVK